MSTVAFIAGLMLMVAPIIAADWSSATVRYQARSWGGWIFAVGFALAWYGMASQGAR